MGDPCLTLPQQVDLYTVAIAMSSAPPSIHPLAVIEQGASIAAGSRVWHHAHIRSGASIGRDCVVGENVFVDADVSIGDGSKIQNNVSVYAGVTIEDRVFVGPSVVFTNDLRPRAASVDWELVPTLVRTGSSIGANATVLCGVTIGEYAMVAAGSVVTRDVRPHELVMGNPARHAGWICRCGETISRDGPVTAVMCSCMGEFA